MSKRKMVVGIMAIAVWFITIAVWATWLMFMEPDMPQGRRMIEYWPHYTGIAVLMILGYAAYLVWAWKQRP